MRFTNQTEGGMSRILIPVDGSERALAAVHEVIRQAKAGATHGS